MLEQEIKYCEGSKKKSFLQKVDLQYHIWRKQLYVQHSHIILIKIRKLRFSSINKLIRISSLIKTYFYCK